MGHNLGHNDLLLKFGILSIFLLTTIATDFKFSVQLPIGSILKNAKLGHRGRKLGHVATP